MKSPKKLYHFHVTNLQTIEQAMNRIARSLRETISKGEDAAVRSFVCLYALLLGAWAECRLRKLIYEPQGFDNLERDKIFAIDTQFGQWQTAIEMAFRKQYKIPRAPLTQNILPHSAFSRYKTLSEMLKDELQPIIELRNKLAHGQWIYLLNSEGDDIAQTQMNKLRVENLLSLQFKRNLITYLSSVIHDLVVSKPTFERDFDNHFRAIIETKRNLLHRNYDDYVEKMRQKYQKGKDKLRKNCATKYQRNSVVTSTKNLTLT